MPRVEALVSATNAANSKGCYGVTAYNYYFICEATRRKKVTAFQNSGGPVRKIQIPAFEFEKANQYEQFYQNELNTSTEDKGGRFRSVKPSEEKVPSLLKPDEKKQSRLGSGRNTLLKPLEEDKLKANPSLIDKAKFYDSNVRM